MSEIKVTHEQKEIACGTAKAVIKIENNKVSDINLINTSNNSQINIRSQAELLDVYALISHIDSTYREDLSPEPFLTPLTKRY